MSRVRNMRNILMELRKTCQHPYLSAPDLENLELSDAAQQKALVEGSGKMTFLKLLLPKLRERGHRVLLFSQFKIALDRIEDFLFGEGIKFLRLDGDVPQAQRQKDMDAFNAPGSEYFIFLLTTRAGGVGINLATADTVIIYDPDFNPHQDLQAIARSHRYGQKKRVLVFKLMTKNSVEEQIILNGKKKMVLDHLVVQQMDKENEEGDIDSMLLHGAAALYDTNEDGTAASDIRYTSKDVDDLIDKVEADAEAEAKAIEERDQRKDESTDAPSGEDGAPKPKESMSFAFAKIWEADTKRLQEVAGDEEDKEEEDDLNAWQMVLDRVEKARQKADLIETGQRARRQAAVGKSGVYKLPADGLHSDDNLENSPSQVSKTHLGKKKRGKKRKTMDASYQEYALNPDEETSEDDEENSSMAVTDLLNLEGKPVFYNGSKLTKADYLRLQKVDATGAAQIAAAAGGLLDNCNAPTVPRPAPALLLPARKGPKDHFKNTTAVKSKVSNGLVDAVKTQHAQHILQWLYHVLAHFHFRHQLDIWARMALPEIPAQERINYYHTLAALADQELARRGQRQYFSLMDVSSSVVALFNARGSVLPDSEDPRIGGMPDLLDGLGVQSDQRLPDPTPARAYDRHLPSPYTSPKASPAFLPKQKATIDLSASTPAQPAAGPSTTTKKPPRALTRIERIAADLAQKPVNRNADNECTVCTLPWHPLRECKQMPTKELLLRHKISVANGNKSEAQKASNLKNLDSLLSLHEAEDRRIEALAVAEARAPLQVQATNGVNVAWGTNAINGKRAALGTKESAIVIDDDEMDEHIPPAKRAKGEGSEGSTGAKVVGCAICGAQTSHPAVTCPRVVAGPQSIKEAVKNFHPSDPNWIMLKSLYDKTAPSTDKAALTTRCAFCGLKCGRTVRECASNRQGGDVAGRKALKDRIRACENEGDPQNVLEHLFDVYLKWPK